MTLWVDSTLGDDLTALRNAFERPFRTIAAAQAAALAGDTVWVKRGTHFANDILKNGVTMHCEDGALVSYTLKKEQDNSGKNYAIFTDKGQPVVASITGMGTFRITSDVVEDDQLVVGTVKSITSLSRGTDATHPSTLATATVTAHGWATGDLVEISGASPSAYNVIAMITVTGTNTFTFRVPLGFDTATGTKTARKFNYGAGHVNAIAFLRNSGSRITMQCKRLEGFLDCDGAMLSLLNGEFYLDALDGIYNLNHPLMDNGAGGKIIYAVACKYHIRAGNIISASIPGSPGYVCRSFDQAGEPMDMYIEADYMEGGGPVVGTESAIGAVSDNYRLNVKVKTLKSTGASRTGACVDTVGGGTVLLDYNRLCGYTNAVDCAGGNIYLNGLLVEDESLAPTATELINVSSGKVIMEGGRIRNTLGKGVVHSGGTTILKNVTIDTSNHPLLPSPVNTSANRPIEISAAGLVLQGCVLLAPTDATEGLYTASGSSIPVTCYNDSYGNKAKSANVGIVAGLGTYVQSASVV